MPTVVTTPRMATAIDAGVLDPSQAAVLGPVVEQLPHRRPEGGLDRAR